MNELTARALTVMELAERYEYADDPGVQRLAKAVVDGEAPDLRRVIEEIEQEYDDDLEEKDKEISALEVKLEELTDKYRDTLDELKDFRVALETMIEKVTKRLKE